MAIHLKKTTKVLVQGFTGQIGSFHSADMIKYGTNIVGGVTPGKGGMQHLEKPVFNTMKKPLMLQVQRQALFLCHHHLLQTVLWKRLMRVLGFVLRLLMVFHRKI